MSTKGMEMSSREEFEKWVSGLNMTPDDPVALVAWMGWKAATERAAYICENDCRCRSGDELGEMIREGNE